MRNHLRTIIAATIAALLSGALVAWAAQTNYLGTVFLADPTTPTRQLVINADGSINVDGLTGSGGTSAVDESAFVLGTTALTPSGGYYQTTATTGPLTNGQVGVAQMTAYRAFHFNARNASGAEVGTAVSPFIVSSAASAGGYSYAHVAAGQATTVVKASAGTLHSITFNGPATATNVTTIYDNASTSGTVIGIPLATAVVSPVTVVYDIAFANGLTIITAAANGADMTVSYK
jgi:hypothetical protein